MTKVIEKRLYISFSKSKINDLSGKRLLDAYDKLEDCFLLMYEDRSKYQSKLKSV